MSALWSLSLKPLGDVSNVVGFGRSGISVWTAREDCDDLGRTAFFCEENGAWPL